MDMNSTGRLALAIASGVFLIVATQSVSAQEPEKKEEDAKRNLQVLPADMPQGEIIATMKNFTRALGVRCTYCHVGEEGKPLSTYDFASDDKKHKQIAREMMKMTAMINKHHFNAEAPADYKVTCYTCHRGSEHPETTAPERPAT